MNILTKLDKELILEHFQAQLKERYNINGSQESLQKSFIKRINNKSAVLYQSYDKYKKAYLVNFSGKKILFVYNHEINICKTALTYNNYQGKK